MANGQGVAGSQAAAGEPSNAGSSGAGGGNSTIAQIGPVTQTLDPILQGSAAFSHKTTPEFNAVQSGTPVLISNSRTYSTSFQQGFVEGGSVTLAFNEHYLNENAFSDVLNPSVAARAFAFVSAKFLPRFRHGSRRPYD